MKYFGMISEKLNLTSERMDAHSDLCDHKDLKKSFVQRYPKLENMTFKIAVNGKISNELSEFDVQTIALLPPFAGG